MVSPGPSPTKHDFPNFMYAFSYKYELNFFFTNTFKQYFLLPIHTISQQSRYALGRLR
jgi:hypothetical protein